MMASALMAFLHFLAAFALVAALVVERVAFAPSMSAAGARRLQRVDMLFGLSAGVVLVAGLLRVEYFEKGPAYYWHDAYFLVKLGVFLIAAVISIYPTITFLAWGPGLKADRAPDISPAVAGRIRLCLDCELACIVIIILCACLMAHGLGALG